MSNQIKTPEIPQAINQCIKQMEPFLNSIEPVMIRLAKQMEPMTEGLKYLNNVFEKIDVKKLNTKLETLSKRRDPFIEGMQHFNKFLQNFDFEELHFNMLRLQKCLPYLEDLRDNVTPGEILKAIEGIPEEEYESTLKRLFGRKGRQIRSRRTLRVSFKIYRLFMDLFALYSFLIFAGVPLPPTFQEFVVVISQQAVQGVEQTKKNPPIRKGFDKKFFISSTGNRKKGSYERCRK